VVKATWGERWVKRKTRRREKETIKREGGDFNEAERRPFGSL